MGKRGGYELRGGDWCGRVPNFSSLRRCDLTQEGDHLEWGYCQEIGHGMRRPYRARGFWGCGNQGVALRWYVLLLWSNGETGGLGIEG